MCFIYTNLFTFRYQYSTIYINNRSEFRTGRSIQWGYYMEKFDKRCPYCGKMMERGEIPRGGGDSPHDIKWIPEHKKGKWYEELLYLFSQEDEDKVIELTSKYYPTIWDEKKCIAYLCRECKIIIIDI